MANTEMIRDYIRASGYKMQYVARALKISPNALNLKLQGRTQFKLSEAERLSAVLGLSMYERDLCFFEEQNRRGQYDVPRFSTGLREQAHVEMAPPLEGNSGAHHGGPQEQEQGQFVCPSQRMLQGKSAHNVHEIDDGHDQNDDRGDRFLKVIP